jgi:hypothetical protein
MDASAIKSASASSLAQDPNATGRSRAQTEQARPHSGHPNHQDTVTCPKPDASWGSPQGDVELMTQKKVLDFKPAWWLEQIGYKRCE